MTSLAEGFTIERLPKTLKEDTIYTRKELEDLYVIGVFWKACKEINLKNGNEIYHAIKVGRRKYKIVSKENPRHHG